MSKEYLESICKIYMENYRNMCKLQASKFTKEGIKELDDLDKGGICDIF